MNNLPYALQQEFVKGNLVLFVGAGFTKQFLSGMPTWEELLKLVFSELEGDSDEIFKYTHPVVGAGGSKSVSPSEFVRLAQVFELVREQRNRNAPAEHQIPGIHSLVQSFILKSYDPDKARKSIIGGPLERAHSLPLLLWVTTNFDTFIEDAILREEIENGNACVVSRPVQTRDFNDLHASCTIIKIHGSVDSYRPETSIVITEDDYDRFVRRDKYLTHKLYTLFCEKTVVFLGYSLSDPNIRSIYNDVLFEQKGLTEEENAILSFPHVRPAFFVSPGQVEEASKVYYRHKKIDYIEKCSIEDFFSELVSIYENDKRRSSDIATRMKENRDEFSGLLDELGPIEWGGALQWDDVRGPRKLQQILELLQFGEIMSRGYQPTVEPFGLPYNEFVGALNAAVTTVDAWNKVLLEERKIDVTDAVLKSLEKSFSNLTSSICKRLLRAVESGLVSHSDLGVDAYAERYVKLIFQYDERFNNWDDYVFCLERYIAVSSLYKKLKLPTRRRYVDNLYHQLRLCGRKLGDSWYSVEKIYVSWKRFSEDCWPDLEKRIYKEAIKIDHRTVFPGHEEQMLEHLKPGADFKQFLPRT